MKNLPDDSYINFYERDGYEDNKITGLKCDYWPRDSSDELVVDEDVRDPDYVGSAYTLVDECANDTHDCDINASCEDTDAGFECHCNEGWTGDGKTCGVYCASGYDAVHPSQGDTGKFQDFAVGDGASLDMGNRGVSTIFVRANCAIITYEEEDFGGRSWIWAGGETDTIYWTWEMAAITDNIEWNDRTKSYKCDCQRMLKIKLKKSVLKCLILAAVDECADSELNECDDNAVCTDTAFQFNNGHDCACEHPFYGDGRTCHGNFK